MTRPAPLGPGPRTCDMPAVHRPLFPHGTIAGRRPADAPCAVSARPYVLVATILGSSMAFIDGTVVHIALPSIQRTIDASFSDLQWIVNIYTLFLGALVLVGGGLGDRLGRRRIFVSGVVVFAAASAFCGLAPTSSSLVAARALQGIGAALLVPQSLAIIAASFPKQERGRAIGLWAGFAAMTTALGPLLGGTLIDLLSWRAAFWLNLPIAALTIWFSVRFIPESRDVEARGRPDWAGAVLIILALAILTYGLSLLPKANVDGYLSMALLVGSLVLFIAYLAVEMRATAPMTPPRLFRSVDFTAANVVTFLLYFTLSGILFLLPFDLIQIRGYTATAAGMALLPFGAVMAVFSGVVGRWADRVGPRWPLTIGAFLVVMASVGLALAPSAGSYWNTVFAPILLLAIGMTVAATPLTTAVMNAVPDRDAGVASGVNNAASRLAGLVAVAVAGPLTMAYFADAVATGLAGLSLPASLNQAVLAQTQELAGIQIPEGLTSSDLALVQNLISESFRIGFRASMYLVAVCAGISALIAALSLKRTRPG